jgi:hypothetical protein
LTPYLLLVATRYLQDSKTVFKYFKLCKKKIAKKYADLIVQANNSTGRKEALSFIKQATKLKTKLDQYEMM